MHTPAAQEEAGGGGREPFRPGLPLFLPRLVPLVPARSRPARARRRRCEQDPTAAMLGRTAAVASTKQQKRSLQRPTACAAPFAPTPRSSDVARAAATRGRTWSGCIGSQGRRECMVDGVAKQPASQAAHTQRARRAPKQPHRSIAPGAATLAPRPSAAAPQRLAKRPKLLAGCGSAAASLRGRAGCSPGGAVGAPSGGTHRSRSASGAPASAHGRRTGVPGMLTVRAGEGRPPPSSVELGRCWPPRRSCCRSPRPRWRPRAGAARRGRPWRRCGGSTAPQMRMSTTRHRSPSSQGALTASTSGRR
mmetsp:Transcript_85920/g.260834  ORF Transcript_85920/g.260834 Transcript_85920/m.260834 type:complete len:306 (+) Transcript_85920:61-978(+)